MSAASNEIVMLNFLVEDKSPKSVTPDQILPRALRALRSHLGMDVAFISELKDGSRVFRYVDGARAHPSMKLGASDPVEDSYCQRVIDGRLPEMIPDVSAVREAAEISLTPLFPAGAHMCVPIRFLDGSIYGALACMRATADPSLGPRDLSIMRVFAEMAAEHIEADMHAVAQRRELVRRLNSVLTGAPPISLVYQPVFDLTQAQVIGFEALARFATDPTHGPDVWFANAALVGLDIRLAQEVMSRALVSFTSLPAPVYVSFNVSPNIAISGELERAFEGAPLERIVLEINEHVTIREYDEISKALRPLRDQGLRISVDESGAGLASFRHILSLNPDVVKLPMSLTRNIDTDSARRALAVALIQFANENGAQVVAEGVETANELKTLRALGVTRAQGYFLGRPAPLTTAATLCRRRDAGRSAV